MKFEQPKELNIGELESSSESLEKKIFDDERKIIGDAGEVLLEAQKDKLKKSGFRALAAFLVFLSGSSHFAEKSFAEDTPEKHLIDSEPKIENIFNEGEEERNLENDIGFDWRRIVKEVDAPRVDKTEETESIDINPSFWDSKIKETRFYNRLEKKDYNEAMNSLYSSVYKSKDYKSFEDKISKLKDLSDAQKLIFLQGLGYYSSKIYDYEMLENNELIKVSEEDMFQELRKYMTTYNSDGAGICGNIHTFMSRVAAKMGVDTWLQSGIVERDGLPNGHVWMGAIIKDMSGESQIIYLDYNILIPTGKIDPTLARGIMERYHKQISVFNSYIGSTEEVIIPIKSLAQEKIEYASGIIGTEKILENNLEAGEIIRENGLEVRLGTDINELKITKDIISLTYIKYEDLDNNDFQSIKNMDALRLGLGLHNENFGIKIDTAVLHLYIKDFENGVISQNEIITRLGVNFINSHDFRKKDFDRFVLSYGLSIETAMRQILNKPTKYIFKSAGGLSEVSGGVRFAYIDPAKPKEFFIEAAETGRVQSDNFEEQKISLKNIGDSLRVGAKVGVNNGSILNLDAKISNIEYGRKYGVGVGADFGKSFGNAEIEKIDSKYDKFAPSSEKISIEAGFRQPVGEIVIYGSKSRDEYNQTTTEKNDFGVKMRMVLW